MKVLFFRAEDIDFPKKRVHAWASTSKDGLSGWSRSYHPLPDVVYENYYLNLVGSDPRLLKVKRELVRRGTPVFNPTLFNKAALHRILSASDSTRKWMPPSSLIRKTSDVLSFLNTHKTVYLKPVNGSGGAGILEVKRLGPDQIKVQSERFTNNQRFTKHFTVTQFQHFITGQLAKRKYLAQKGLKLIHRGKQKIDFRIVVHRDHAGVWKSVGVRPKLGKAGSIVTNSHAGGHKTTWNQLSQWSRQEGLHLPEKTALENAAITVAERLTAFRPYLSHLGIDVAVCEDGEIYVLDINPRPGRDLLTPEMLELVTQYTAGFASYLARRRVRSSSHVK
ncbi:YheC/YheD family protein [Alicyclobacillus fastidiosus]|uniref:YheC/YheD family protein n=2 Tax=Alicyclobacillus fastidiosus TaxID=392011 RepID=A0ABV5AA33_9BACL